MPTGRLAKWKMLLTEFDIIYVMQTGTKTQALAVHFADNPIEEKYEPLKTYFQMKRYLVSMKFFVITIKDGSCSLTVPLITNELE